MNFSHFYRKGVSALRSRARLNGTQRKALQVSHTPTAIYSRSLKHK